MEWCRPEGHEDFWISRSWTTTPAYGGHNVRVLSGLAAARFCSANLAMTHPQIGDMGLHQTCCQLQQKTDCTGLVAVDMLQAQERAEQVLCQRPHGGLRMRCHALCGASPDLQQATYFGYVQIGHSPQTLDWGPCQRPEMLNFCRGACCCC